MAAPPLIRNYSPEAPADRKDKTEKNLLKKAAPPAKEGVRR